ncbi:MAG: CRTAC1 family protein [Acidobacteriales bacterium]|nr:CRTAC1 family protein [Terriglobales bacterium]
MIRQAVILTLVLAVPALSPQDARPDLSFTDVAPGAGLTATTVFGGAKTKRYIVETTGGGVAFLDYDNDGWLDIFLANGSSFNGASATATNHLYRNNHDGTFTDVTRRAGLDKPGWGQGVCAGDYDNDGNTDLFVTYWGRNVLYRNNGDGTFTDVTEAAGLKKSRPRWGSGCAFLDYDRDGLLDLFVSNYVDFDLKTAPDPGSSNFCRYRGLAVNCGPRGLPGESNLLFRNMGHGRFGDVSEKAGIARARGYFGLGVLTSDFDNDGWPDIYVANDKTASLLFHNNRDGTFEETGVFAGCAYDADGKVTSGMGVAAADFDRDGWLDILKTNFSDESASFYHNTRDGLFVDAALQLGLGRSQKWVGWGCGFADFDNDGWPDIFVVNGHVFPELDGANLGLSFLQPKVVYRNVRGEYFEDVSARAGAAVTTLSAARGAAFGDFNNDGRLDIVINNMNDRPSLLRSEVRNRNHWILIRLEGVKSNRSAIGARVTCVTGKFRQIDEVRSGGSFFSQNDFRVHFGLGSATRIDLLEIRWPSGSVDRIPDCGVDQILNVKEGVGIVSKTP